jgi:hypothetical protein
MWSKIAPPRLSRLLPRNSSQTEDLSHPKSDHQRDYYTLDVLFSLYGPAKVFEFEVSRGMEEFQVFTVKMPKPKNLKPKLPVRRKLVAVGDMFSGQRALLS